MIVNQIPVIEDEANVAQLALHSFGREGFGAGSLRDDWAVLQMVYSIARIEEPTLSTKLKGTR
jgi:hypothetical protein